MNWNRLKQLLLPLILLRHVCSEEPELVFRAEGDTIEIGYCGELESIIVYRTDLEGDQLIGNSSNHIPGGHLQGRAQLTDDYDLLGLRIGNLTHTDSGTYRRECWRNQTQVSQSTLELSVCDMESELEEIVVKKEMGGAQVWCNSSVGLEGTSMRWYQEMYPTSKLALFFDSSVSFKPLVEVPGVVEVKEKGALLVLDDSVVQNTQNFYCLIMNSSKCVSFQNIYLPDPSENLDVFVSRGDRVVLSCPAHGQSQEWETPVGKISQKMKNEVMYISAEQHDFSLVIPSVSDDHSGDYSCLSSLDEIHYSLVLCSRKETSSKACSEGSSVSLVCNTSQRNSQRVQWYRYEHSGQYEIIQDNKDTTTPIPEGLRGRLTLSEDGLLMKISDLVTTDSGEYWCVVLQSDQHMENDRNYTAICDEDDVDSITEYSDYDYLPIAQRCLLKMVTNLTVLPVETGRSGSKEAVTPFGLYTTVALSKDSNVAAYAVVGVLVGLLVVGAIVAGIVVKERANASRTERQAASPSPAQISDIELQRDPGCTERLTNPDPVD